MEPVIVTRLYLKPLLPTRPFGGLSIEKVLRLTKNDLNRRLKAKLLQTTFSDRAKKALARSIQIKINPSSLVISSDHPAFMPLLKGQKSEQMTWLRKSPTPIPIITETGELIFRSATAKSMADGRWVHPGRKPSNFLDKARKEAREFIKGKLLKEVQKDLNAAFRRMGAKVR